jgi:hypothetical protein
LEESGGKVEGIWGRVGGILGEGWRNLGEGHHFFDVSKGQAHSNVLVKNGRGRGKNNSTLQNFKQYFLGGS